MEFSNAHLTSGSTGDHGVHEPKDMGMDDAKIDGNAYEKINKTKQKRKKEFLLEEGKG
jgi:hypothetical protein